LTGPTRSAAPLAPGNDASRRRISRRKFSKDRCARRSEKRDKADARRMAQLPVLSVLEDPAGPHHALDELVHVLVAAILHDRSSVAWYGHEDRLHRPTSPNNVPKVLFENATVWLSRKRPVAFSPEDTTRPRASCDRRRPTRRRTARALSTASTSSPDRRDAQLAV
jgi:hypothetical protein